MSFLAAASQKALLNMQKSFLQFSGIALTNQINVNKQLMSNIEQVDPENYSDDPYYMLYAQLDEEYTEQKDSLEEEVNLITQQITALSTQIKTEMQNSCKLNYAGGS